MRSHYETEAHLWAEADIVDSLTQAWGVTLVKKEVKGYSLDYDMFTGIGGLKVISGVVEIKNVSYSFGVYPLNTVYCISAKKFRAGIAEAELKNILFILAVNFRNGLYFYRYRPEDMARIHFKAWGRKDRGDPWDIEEAAAIPLDLFFKVSEVPLK